MSCGRGGRVAREEEEGGGAVFEVEFDFRAVVGWVERGGDAAVRERRAS